MSAFTRYKRGEFDEAVTSGKRYLTLYPGSDDAAYAQFIIMDSYFSQMPDVTRDQAQTAKAIDAANELIQRYPDSPYAGSAKQRLAVARNQMAGKEMDTGRYYLQRHDYIGRSTASSWWSPNSRPLRKSKRRWSV